MLDINTEKGQKSLLDERHVQEYIQKCWGVQIIETSKESSAACDGFIVKNGVITACFETKCRYDMSYDLFLERGSWLITLEKIKKGKTLSKLLQVPYYGFLFLKPDEEPDSNLLLFTKITNKRGEYIYQFRTEIQETQKTTNGGLIQRLNAYLPAENLRIVKPEVFIGK